MCNCNKKTCSYCSCNPYCKTTILAQCVNNLKKLSVLKGTSITKLKTLLLSINNLLKSISDIECVTYTRTIDPNTNIATFTHEIDYECLAEQVCEICRNPCFCEPPSELSVIFTADGFTDTDLYRAVITWLPSATATSYRIEYKKSEDSEWSIADSSHTSTLYDDLILSLSGEDVVSYDFRVKALCEGCESEYITISDSIKKCESPTNLIWTQDSASLSWNAEPFLSTSFEISYKKPDETLWTVVTVPVSEITSGSYVANFFSITFDVDTTYSFRVRRKCGTRFSSSATGCAYNCTVALMSDPSFVLHESTAFINWTISPFLGGYNIRIYNNTDDVVTYPETFIGYVGTFTRLLEEGKSYTVTLTPVCLDGTPSCGGRSIEIEVPSIPDFTIYNAVVASCEEYGCDEHEIINVAVPYGEVLLTGGYYNDILSSSNIYKIVSLSESTVYDVIIDSSTHSVSCEDKCPPSFRYYNVEQYRCDNGCKYEEDIIIKRSYSDPALTVYYFYEDAVLNKIYKVLSETTYSSSALELTTIGASAPMCSLICPPVNNFYNATILTCDVINGGCVDGATEVVYSYVGAPLTTGLIYKDFSGVRYRIDSLASEVPSAVLIDSSTTYTCEDECPDPNYYYTSNLYQCGLQQCTMTGTMVIKSSVPLLIGSFYKDTLDPINVIYEITATSTYDPTTKFVINTPYSSCMDACNS